MCSPKASMWVECPTCNRQWLYYYEDLDDVKGSGKHECSGCIAAKEGGDLLRMPSGKIERFTVISLQINMNLESLTLKQLERWEQFANGIIINYKEAFGGGTTKGNPSASPTGSKTGGA